MDIFIGALYEGKNGVASGSILHAFGPLAPESTVQAARACRHEVAISAAVEDALRVADLDVASDRADHRDVVQGPSRKQPGNAPVEQIQPA